MTIFLTVSMIMTGFCQQLRQLPVDSTVLTGRRDDGLTYYIRHNDMPAGRTEHFIVTKGERIRTASADDMTDALALCTNPASQAIIIVGDMSPEEAEYLICAASDSIPATDGCLPERRNDTAATLGIIEPDFRISNTSERPDCRIEIIWREEAFPKELNGSEIRFTNDILNDIIAGILNERFDSICTIDSGILLHAGITLGVMENRQELTIAEAYLRRDEFRKGYDTIMEEIGRIGNGFTPDEISSVKERILSRFAEAVLSKENRSNISLVYPLMLHFVYGLPYMDPDDKYSAAVDALERLTDDIINQAAAEAFAEENMHVSYYGPQHQSAATKTLTGKQLRKCRRAVRKERRRAQQNR